MLRSLNLRLERSTHTALIGSPGSGKTTLLRILAGELRPQKGVVLIGSRDVTSLVRSRRPLLLATSKDEFPGRWSVNHVLVAALRTRTLDREDRRIELDHLLEKWTLRTVREERTRTLSSHQSLLLRLARIEALRPAILIAGRFLENASPATAEALADTIYRSLRIMGTTVLSEVADLRELGMCDRVAVMEDGSIAQTGTSQEVYRQSVSIGVAEAVGAVNRIPIAIAGNSVESPIGSWQLSAPPFQGTGIAMARPEDFVLARGSEESDFVFGIEEAQFACGVWRLRGFITGALLLTVALPDESRVHKGRLLPLRFDPRRFQLFPGPSYPTLGVPIDVLPSMKETR